MNKLAHRIVLGSLCLTWLTVAAFGQSPTTRAAPRDRKATNDVHTLARKGWPIGPEEVQRLEEKVAADPDNLESRIMLLGHYSRTRYRSHKSYAAHIRHALWIIEHRPASKIAGSSYAELDRVLDGSVFARGKQLWLKHVEDQPKNVAILANAAEFFNLYEPETTEKLLQRLQTLQPKNSRWPRELGNLQMLHAWRRDGDINPDAARKAYTAYEQALQRVSGARERHALLEEAARSALHAGILDKAQQYAQELLDTAVEASHAATWNFGNAVHHGNLVLGHIALLRGDLKRAEEHLIKAGKTPGSPQLNSFGPNMLLARELLRKKRPDAVIEYLRLCGVFWDRTKTDAWIKMIEAGGIPGFGGNLRY